MKNIILFNVSAYAENVMSIWRTTQWSDAIQYECLKIASLFFLSNCCISFIPDDSLRI